MKLFYNNFKVLVHVIENSYRTSDCFDNFIELLLLLLLFCKFSARVGIDSKKERLIKINKHRSSTNKFYLFLIDAIFTNTL